MTKEEFRNKIIEFYDLGVILEERRIYLTDISKNLKSPKDDDLFKQIFYEFDKLNEDSQQYIEDLKILLEDLPQLDDSSKAMNLFKLLQLLINNTVAMQYALSKQRNLIDRIKRNRF